MRVLGLDISKDAVTCVEIESAFGRFEIRETHEAPVAGPDSDPVAVAARLIASLPGKPGRVITAAPMELGTFRNIQLATRDKKAIRSALQFELEDDLPFESENLHYDHAILPSEEAGTLVHVGAVKKDRFGAYLESLAQAGLDPDFVTSDAWAYRCLFSRFRKSAGKAGENDSVLLVGFERHKTFFHVNSGNRPVLYREIPFGVAHLESALQERLGSGHEEARSWVHDIGVSGINEQVSNAIAEILELLVPEIKQTELAARGQLRTAIGEIQLTGEGALLPGIASWFESAASKACVLFRPLSALSGGKIAYSDLSEVRFAKALALATTLIPADKIPVLNLRKGPFARAGASTDSPFELAKKPLPYLLATTAVLIGTKTIEYQYYEGRLAETDTQLKRAVKAYYGDISDGAARSYLASPEKLKKTIQDDLAKERQLSKLFAPNPGSPLHFLKSLSEKIGRDVVVDLVNFDAGTDNTEPFVENRPLKVSLAFIVPNAQVMSKLNDLIEKNFGLRRGNSEEINREGRKAFRIPYSGTLGGGK